MKFTAFDRQKSLIDQLQVSGGGIANPGNRRYGRHKRFLQGRFSYENS
jgi:hypothetical protein